MLRVVLIGAGNVACSLGPALQGIAEIDLVQLWSRSEQSAKKLGDELRCGWTTDIQAIVDDADVYLYALKDCALESVVSHIDVPNALHLHTAGSVGLEVFGAKEHAGVVYPFQTFSRNRRVCLAGVPIFIESKQPSDLERIRSLAQMISGAVYDFNSDNRKWLHLAGVFANNFSNLMFGIAQEMAQRAGLDSEVLLPLMDETVLKLHSMDSLQAQTGPAARGDMNVIARQKAMIDNADYRELYDIASKIIMQRSQK